MGIPLILALLGVSVLATTSDDQSITSWHSLRRQQAQSTYKASSSPHKEHCRVFNMADGPDVPMDSQSPDEGDSQQTVVMEEQSQQGEQTAVSKEDSIMEQTAVPKEDSIMEQTAVPKEDTITEQTAVPKEDTIMEQTTIPKEDSVMEQTTVPKEDSVTEQTTVPKEDTITEQTAVPKEDTIMEQTAVLKEDSIMEQTTVPNQAVAGTCEMEQPTAGKEDGTAKEEGVKQEASKVKQAQAKAKAKKKEATTVDKVAKGKRGKATPPPEFPTTLKGFGYAFNKDGQLRNIETGEPFLFEVKKGNKAYNQAHYEALGEVITEFVYQLLETEGNLKKITVPVTCIKNEPQSFFFMSEDALTNPDRLMILIHGSGVVRAGQWARRLIMNDCLDSGTQLPFIKRAMSEGYGVMVLNTNKNAAFVDDKAVAIRENSTPQEHALNVWKQFVKKAKAKRIDIVAHSFGGVVTTAMAAQYFDDFKKRVHKIAFTDSVHDMDMQRTPRNVRRWITEHAVNWVSSPDPLDTFQPAYRSDVRRVSAGTKKHEETSWHAFDSVFTYFRDASS